MPRNRRLDILSANGQRKGSDASGNPLFPRHTISTLLREHRAFFTIFFLTLVLTFVYGVLYSPIFAIRKIEIVGGNTASQESIRQIALSWMNKRTLPFVQWNLFTLSKHQLQNKITDHWSLNTLTIAKHLPGTLKISISEKKPIILYESGDLRFTIDEAGTVVSIVEPGILQELPCIIDESGVPPKVGDTLFTTSILDFTRSFPNSFIAVTGEQVDHWVRPAENVALLYAVSSSGWKVFFDTQKDLTQQQDNFTRVWKEQFTVSPPREYIDLRILDRVYYK